MQSDAFAGLRPVIDTARLRIRPMCPDDIPALREWMPDPSLYTYWGKGPGKAERNPELLFRAKGKPAKDLYLGIAEKASGKVTGDLLVSRIEKGRMASVAVRIAPGRQGQGFGSEALAGITRSCLEHAGMKRLWAEADARNAAALRMLAKCGYRKEALIRQGKLGSTWCDICIFGFLADDMEEAAERVSRMEALFDMLSDAVGDAAGRAETDGQLRKAARTLSRYQAGGQWIRDYEMDGCGMLPDSLKRGVLSQDGLYDLLCDPGIRALLEESR